MSDQSAKVVLHKQQVRIGPLPSAQELADYDRAIPGLAERIVQMAEKEQEIRLKNTTLFYHTMRLGTWFAFILPVIGLGATVYLAMNASVWPAIIPFPVSIVPSVVSHWRRSKEVFPPESD